MTDWKEVIENQSWNDNDKEWIINNLEQSLEVFLTKNSSTEDDTNLIYLNTLIEHGLLREISNETIKAVESLYRDGVIDEFDLKEYSGDSILYVKSWLRLNDYLQADYVARVWYWFDSRYNVNAYITRDETKLAKFGVEPDDLDTDSGREILKIDIISPDNLNSYYSVEEIESNLDSIEKQADESSYRSINIDKFNNLLNSQRPIKDILAELTPRERIDFTQWLAKLDL